MVEWVRALATGRSRPCSNPAAATSLRNFGNSVYPALPVSLGGDTAVGPFYLVSMPREVKDPTSPPVVDYTIHSNPPLWHWRTVPYRMLPMRVP